MIYLDDDYREFAKKHGISLRPSKCRGCKKEFVPTIPIAISGYRGLKAGPHGCDTKYQIVRLVPVSKEEMEFWLGWRSDNGL